MQAYLSLLAITGSLAVGAMSPGPSFVVVARNSIALSRQHGYATALGMGTGAGTFALIALLGLHAVLSAVPLAFWAFKIAGGLYLLYLAYQILSHAREPLPEVKGSASLMSLKRAYFYGLLTQLSNPKTAIVFASVFSALLPPVIPLYFYIALPVLAALVDGCWYLLVAYLLSAETPRKTYLTYKAWIDGLAGTVMGLLGIRLLLSKLPA
ncbi:LysE family translocator [Thiolinea disciformis]|uniref:LysE family translocator n=1 Tax=Thiolinea disciformis TaxID=125614 RepID=UPI00036445DC|nr:LysE family transporter [Thiolinea disciformis]